MQMKDLPHPGQRWIVFNSLLVVTRISMDMEREGGTQWWVDFDWIYKNGDMRFYEGRDGAIGATGSGSLELGRFLRKAERQS